MSDPVLLVEKNEGIVTLTLNRPEAMNALSNELRYRLTQTFQELREDAETRVVILTGNGRAFCAGLDLKEMVAAGVVPLGPGEQEAGRDFSAEMDAFDRPIIGAVNGVAVTGGFELALACDFLVASSAARFADTHARVGIVPGWGLSQRLSRLIGIGRAKELSFTGNYITAEQALSWGLVNRVTTPEDLMPTCRALAEDMLSCVPGVVRDYKRLIDEGYGMSFSNALEMEKRVSVEYAKRVTAESLGAVSRGVRERGRKQTE